MSTSGEQLQRAERLRQARLSAGFKTARAGGERVGVVYDTYAQHENGTRGIPKESIAPYARAYQIDPTWLLTGRGQMRPRAIQGIPVVGRVSAGFEGDFTDDFAMGAADDYLEPLDPEGHICLRVEGTSMVPRFFPGEKVVFGPRFDDPKPLIGQQVMARLRDGRKLLKVLRAGSTEGRYTLLSINTSFDPIEDVELEWVLPFKELRS